LVGFGPTKFGTFSGFRQTPDLDRPQTADFLGVFGPSKFGKFGIFWGGLGVWDHSDFVKNLKNQLKNEVSKSEPNFCLWQKFGEVRTNFCPDFYKILPNFQGPKTSIKSAVLGRPKSGK
jgi:hypothetical protein